ncbi:MAG TPA: HPr kinase/phosphatase C-terminal domain-containing protein [Xanthobacteraceae bacterium]|jgi:serine kinase of HPr protein (carbohydrate metabolism regulator)
MPSIHASAVLVGARALLIRGPSGAGKSRLVLALLRQSESGTPAFVRLVSDDRSLIAPHHGRLVVRPVPEIAGLIEVRGLGIRRIAYEPAAVVGCVVDLAAPDGERLPASTGAEVIIEGISLPRLAVAADAEPLALVLAKIASATAGGSAFAA